MNTPKQLQDKARNSDSRDRRVKKPLHVDRDVAQTLAFANAELKTARDVLRLKLTSALSEGAVLHDDGSFHNEARFLSEAQRAQKELRRLLTGMVGEVSPELVEDIVRKVNSTGGLRARATVKNGRVVTYVDAVPYQRDALMPVIYAAAFRMLDKADRLKVCRLTEWVRDTSRGRFVTPGCGKFLWGGKALTCPEHATLYRTQLTRGRKKA